MPLNIQFSDGNESLAYQRLALSRPYKFIVGPNNTQFYIHTILVAAQSRILAALIHGNMREATNRRVRWPHVSEETFDHFVEFLYTQNYHSDEEVKPTVDACSCGRRRDTNILEIWYRLPRTFTRLYSMTRGFGKYRDDVEALANPFVVHARIYVFRDYYDIKNLQKLALEKLHHLMIHLATRGLPILGVWMRELIPFAYENTLPSENDKLRSLVSMCAACMRRVPQYGAAFEKLEEDTVDFREAVSKLHRTI